MSEVKPYKNMNELLQQESVPCVYTDVEFVQVLAEAEASGYVTHEEALKEFKKWGFVR